MLSAVSVYPGLKNYNLGTKAPSKPQFGSTHAQRKGLTPEQSIALATKKLQEINAALSKGEKPDQKLVNYTIGVQKESRKALEHSLNEASIDALSGVFNRRAYDNLLKKEIVRAERDKKPLSVLMLDTDYFKQVNDTYGHQVGDSVIQAMAKSVVSSLRETDIVGGISNTPAVGRYGGEEFAVILTNTSAKQAALVAERIRKKFESLTFTAENGEIFNKTVSIGVAPAVFANQSGAAISANDISHKVMADADRMLYKAKGQGRNRVKVLDPLKRTKWPENFKRS
ncbi:MAG: GGDEF domain-containing protein [Vampirovibrionales bacterium]|nr:GGDEF domain-containing protein [Vampirovibrionales bacterium]